MVSQLSVRHSRTVLSADLVASSCPSAEKETAVTGFLVRRQAGEQFAAGGLPQVHVAVV
jgi:hypothetical protein